MGLMEVVRSRAGAQAEARLELYLAEIVEVDRVGYRAKCKILTTGHRTGWCRIGTDYAGGGYGDVADVESGMEVLLGFVGGNPAGQGIVIRRLFGAAKPPALGTGEHVSRHKSGTVVTVEQDGKVKVTGVSSVDMNVAGQVAVDGTMIVLGGGVSAAVKHEELMAGLMPWLTVVSAALTALGITISPPGLGSARATKVKVG